MSQARIEVLEPDEPLDDRALGEMGLDRDEAARLSRLEESLREQSIRDQEPDEPEVEPPEGRDDADNRQEEVKDKSTVDERRELAKAELEDQESRKDNAKTRVEDPKLSNQRIDGTTVRMQTKTTGSDTYSAQVDKEVRDRDLGHYTSEERPVDRDGGKGVEAVVEAYVADAERQGAKQAEAKDVAKEPAAEPSRDEPATVVKDTEERRATDGEDRHDTVGRMDEVDRDQADQVQAPARVPDHPAVDQHGGEPQTIPKDEAKAAAEKHPVAAEQERAISPGLVVDLTEDGRHSQLFLHGMQHQHPDVYAHPGFKVVVGAPTEERAEILRRSGAFDEYVKAGKADITTIDHQQPVLPADTRLVFAPPVNSYPAVRLYGEGGATKVGGEVTKVKGRDVVVTADEENNAVARDPYFFRRFGTIESANERMEVAPKLAGRLTVSFVPADLEISEVARREITAANAVSGLPDREFVNYQPGLEDMLVRLADQAELVYANGNMADNTNRPPRDRLLQHEGMVAINMTEIAALQRAAERAGATLTVPPGEPGGQHYALINSSRDEVERAMVAQAFDQVASGPDRPVLALVRKAEQYLTRERAGELSPNIPAVQSILDSYATHLRDYPEAEIDYDLALALSRVFYKFGHYDQAVAMADRAIAAAPQVAAAAHTLKARALMPSGELAVARREIGLALNIAPHDRHVYRAIAQLSATEGKGREYLAALVEERKLTPGGDNWEDVKAWRAIVDTMIAEAMQASDEPDQLRIVERTVKNETTGEWVIRHEAQRVSSREVALSRALEAQIAAEDAIRELFDNGPGELQDPAMAIIKNVRGLEEATLPLPEHLVYTADEAQLLASLRDRIRHSVEGRVASLEVTDMPNLAGNKGSVLLGYKIDDQGKQLETPDSWVSVIYDELNRHFFIAGASGSGKSTLERILYKQLALQGMAGMLVDGGRRSQFKPLVKDLLKAGVDVSYMDPTDMAMAAITLRLLAPEPGFPVQEHMQNFKRVLWMMTAAREPFSQIANRAVQQLYSEAGFRVRDRVGKFNPDAMVDSPETPLLDQFVRLLMREADASGYDRIRGDINAMVGNRASDLSMDPLLSFIGDGDQELSVPGLVKGFSVLDLSNVENPVNSLIGATLAIRIEEYLRLRHQRNDGNDLPLNFVFGLGEGQFILGKPQYVGEAVDDQIKRAESLGASLTGWRGLGGGVEVSTHEPRRVIDQVIGNSAIKVALKTEDPDDRDTMIRAMGGTQDQYDRLGRVKPGQGLIRYGGEEEAIFMQVQPTSREQAVVREPRNLSEMPIRGIRREPLLTKDEREAAEIAVNDRKNADWVLWTTALTLALETNHPIPQPIGNIREKWDRSDPRTRETELDMHLTNVIRERSPYSSEELMARVKHVALNALSGGPVVGKLPGTTYVNPQLQWLIEYERRAQPYYQQVPSRSGPGLPIAGLGGRPETIPSESVEVQLEALSNHEYASRGPGEGPERNREIALRAIMGDEHGRRFYRALEQFYVGTDPDEMARLRALDVALGFVREGEPRPGLLSRLMSFPTRVIRWQ